MIFSRQMLHGKAHRYGLLVPRIRTLGWQGLEDLGGAATPP
jgi:hypothetical protein